MLIGHITAALADYAPTPLQEDYDNCGLIIGSPSDECTGVLLSVDVTPAVVQEAIDTGCNLIVAHHPLIFRGLKRLNGSTPVEQAVIKAVRGGIAVYACHTCLDNAPGGVSARMAQMLGLKDIAPLQPQTDLTLKLVTFVPPENFHEVRMALFDAGAGKIGNYDSCSFSVQGTGTFRALDGASPHIGEIGKEHFQTEERLEVILPSWRRNAVEEALLQTHPYEEPAYEFIRIDTPALHSGTGAIGNLPKPVDAAKFIETVKNTFGSPVARCSEFPADGKIRRVALCGGSGSSLISHGAAAGAQAFITSDTSYHTFLDWANQIQIIDIGHFESENCTKQIFYRIITEKFPNFAVRYSAADINPIKYL